MQFIKVFNDFFKESKDKKLSNIKRAALVLSLLSFASYFLAFFGYFQADEWYFFSKHFITLRQPLGALKLIFAAFFDPLTYGAHFTPLLPPIGFVNIQLFGTNFIFYQLESVLLHIGVTLCVFYFAYLLTKKNLYFGLLAGMFFGISVVHYQAVSWIAAVGVQIAMLFALLSLIFAVKYYQEKVKVKTAKNLSILFFILAVLSKESALFLFFVYPLIVYLFNRNEVGSQKSILQKGIHLVKEIRYIIIFGIFYAIVLIGFQQVIKLMDQSTGDASTLAYGSFFSTLNDLSLLYKIISWSLKSIAETFIPANYLYSMGELITIWGFPYYAKEASVHGINFLTFAQSAGMEMFIYPAAILLLILIHKINNYFSLHNKRIKNTILIGLVCILASVIPFIFIANSIINLFGFATILDSRHIYTTSIGGALIFAAFFTFLFEGKKSILWKYFAAVMLCIWIVINLFLLEKILIDNASVGSQRKTIVNAILNKAPSFKKDALVLVESNAGYYGFGLMPPFQTNLGQALMLLYHQKGQLPVEFLKTDFLIKGGIAGQGYLRMDGKGFGYFIEEKNLLWALGQNKLSPYDIYAFKWDGVKNTLSDNTKKIRDDAKNYLELLSYFDGWKTYQDASNGFSFEYPPQMTISDISIDNANEKNEIVKDISISTEGMQSCVDSGTYDCDGLYLRITLLKKSELVGTDNFAAKLKNSDGGVMGQDYTFRVIRLLTGDEVTTVYASKGKYPTYFIPFETGDRIFQVRAFGKRATRILAPVTFEEKWNSEIERILSTLKYESQQK